MHSLYSLIAEFPFFFGSEQKLSVNQKKTIAQQIRLYVVQTIIVVFVDMAEAIWFTKGLNFFPLKRWSPT